MSNAKVASGAFGATGESPSESPLPTPKNGPIVGPEGQLVQRISTQRQRSLIGAWCFVDH